MGYTSRTKIQHDKGIHTHPPTQIYGLWDDWCSSIEPKLLALYLKLKKDGHILVSSHFGPEFGRNYLKIRPEPGPKPKLGRKARPNLQLCNGIKLVKLMNRNMMDLSVLKKSEPLIVSFNFLCSAVQKFHFGRFVLRRTPKFVQINFLSNILLHYIVSFNFPC